MRLPILTFVLVAVVSAQQQYPPSGYPNSGQQAPSYGQPQYPAYGQAQPQYPGPEAADDQAHGVARLSIVQGDVNIKRGDNGQLSGAAINAPLVAHDHLETAPGSRAEVQLDSATMLRLAPNTDIGFADLEFQRIQAQLGIGTVVLRVLRDGGNSQVELDTPSVALRPLSIGEYRISVFDNGTSQVTVRSGRLEMSGPRGSQTVEPGQSLLIRGDAADPEFQTSYEIPRDQIDEWSAARDSELLASQSYRYVSPDVDGAEDLDRYGNWVPSQYGQVWAPQSQSPDWSPYSNGHWVWEDYYGWTWVDYAPWGWAPYHYGRWFWNTGIGWCWWPGGRGFGLHWSPALVGFFGWGAGELGWVALAPFELFHPWWGRGFGHYNYGFERGGELARLYRNAAIRGGAMTAPLNGFAGPEHRYSPATRSQLGNASLFRGPLPVSANAAAYRYSSRQPVINQRLSAGANRQFFSRPAINQARASGYRYPSASTPTARPNFAGSAAGRGGWQSFGSPGSASAAPRQSFAAPNSPNSESGWHRFGQPQTTPRQSYGFVGGSRNAPAASPRYSPAPQPRYSAPAAPRYKAPPAPSYHESGSHGSSGGGSGGHSSGGGHSGGGGHRGR